MDIALKSHDALSDVLITKLLLRKLMQQIQYKYDVASESQIIQQLIDLSSSPVLLKRFKFGKYKGESIEDVAMQDYGYLQWMRKTLDLDNDMKYTLDYY